MILPVWRDDEPLRRLQMAPEQRKCGFYSAMFGPRAPRRPPVRGKRGSGALVISAPEAEPPETPRCDGCGGRFAYGFGFQVTYEGSPALLVRTPHGLRHTWVRNAPETWRQARRRRGPRPTSCDRPRRSVPDGGKGTSVSGRCHCSLVPDVLIARGIDARDSGGADDSQQELQASGARSSRQDRPYAICQAVRPRSVSVPADNFYLPVRTRPRVPAVSVRCRSMRASGPRSMPAS